MEGERTIVNWRMLLRVIGWLLMVESAFMCLPAICSLTNGGRDLWTFFFSALATFVVGFSLTGIHAYSSYMGKREGFLLTAVTWIVFSIFGMQPFLWCDQPFSVSDSFFEAMSGFTTTGASILASYDHLSPSIHLWRCLMQWIGGMGIILFTLAIIPKLNHSGGMQMFNAEVTGITHDKIRPRISQTAKSLWLTYFTMTAACFIFLLMGPMTSFESLCHALSCLSTGGYSTQYQSVGAWNSCYIKIVILVFMFLGGTNFALIINSILKKTTKVMWSNSVFKIYLAVIGGAFILLDFAILLGGHVTSWQTLTIDSLFMVVSLLTSTGFAVVNFETWGHFILVIFILLMFSGACAGSTSGGAKLDRMVILLQNCKNELIRAFHPNSIQSVHLNRKIVAPEMVNKAVAFLCIYVLIIVIGGSILTLIGIPMVDAFFSAFSCIGNTGLGAGVTGYGESFETIHDFGKWVLALLMLIGRLEIYTVLVLFIPSFWRR